MTDEQSSTANVAPMSANKRKRLQQCFDRANELASKAKPDHDYAHDLYAQAVVNDPGNLIYVEAMLDNLQKKFNNNKKGSRFNFGGKKTFKSAVAEQDWADVFSEGLELLKANPWDTVVLKELAKACAFNRFNEVELRYLKNALDGKPSDIEVNRHCAQSLARMGQFDMAIACWNRISEKTKGDEAERMMSELTLAKTMGSSLSHEAIGVTGPNPVAPMPGSLPQDEAEESTEAEAEAAPNDDESGDSEARETIALNARQTLEKAIRENPTDASSYLELAELHSHERRYPDAEKVLGKAIQAVGASLKLQAAYEDAQIRTAKARVAIAEQRAASAKTDESRELVTSLRGELNRLELDILQKRVQQFPDNRRMRYDLGVRLRRAGNQLEAIKSFDAAGSDATLLCAAMLEMGECWQQLKQYKKSLKCYTEAIQSASDADADRHKMSLYRGAILAAAMKQVDQAKAWFQDLLQMDPTFRDAASRLDKIQ